MDTPPIKGFIESTLIDWQGKVASIIFMPGCNFRCHYCHATHLVLESSELESIPLENILNYLSSSNGWIDGVVISGGEPTLEPGLENLIDKLRELKLLIKLDTNGSRPEVLKKLIRLHKIDAIAMDIKAPLNPDQYSEVAGVDVDIEKISDSIDFLLSVDGEVEFRTTVCPAFLDEEAIIEIAKRIRGARHYFLQGFRPINCLNQEMLEIKPYPLSYMEKILKSVREYVPNSFIRGYKYK